MGDRLSDVNDQLRPTKTPVLLRDFIAADAAAVNAVESAAVAQYRHAYADWAAFSLNSGRISALAGDAEIVVAVGPDRIVGAIAYAGPGRPTTDFFPQHLPILRMLAVHPHWRGLGIGGALTEECIRRARRDGASTIALHATPVMTMALGMYQRMGFEFATDAPAIHGVAYAIYLKPLH